MFNIYYKIFFLKKESLVNVDVLLLLYIATEAAVVILHESANIKATPSAKLTNFNMS